MAHKRSWWRRYRGWVAATVLLAIGAAVLFAMRSATATEQPETTYSTTAAENGTLQVTVSGTGNLSLASTTDAWPDAAGVVDSVEVEEGDAVKAGQVLFTLEPDDADAAVAKALASYRQTQSSVAQASAQVTRADSSLDALEERSEAPSSTVTSADIELAKAELAAAKASLTSAKSQRSNALADYNDALEARENLQVTAPVAGRVYSVGIEAGDSVSASSGGSTSAGSGSSAGTSGSTSGSTASSSGSSAPVVISSTKPLVATLSVNEVDLPSLELGQRVDLEFDALPDLALTGKVTDIADEGTVEQGVVSFDVEIALDVRNKQLKPGMSVSATIVTAVARDVLLVPNAAVKSDDDGTYVHVLDSTTGLPRRVGVEVGMAGDTQTEIVSGLSEGDEVVTATTDSSDAENQSGARPGGGMMFMGGGPR